MNKSYFQKLKVFHCFLTFKNKSPEITVMSFYITVSVPAFLLFSKKKVNLKTVSHYFENSHNFFCLKIFSCIEFK